MANEEDSDTPEIKLPIAKRHSILQDISKQMHGHELDTTIEVGGHVYLITTIDADDELWADGVLQINSPTQVFMSFKMTRLCAAIKEIDGVPVEELFDFPDDMSKEDKLNYSATRYAKRTWVLGQMYMWIGSDVPPPIIDVLYAEYKDINAKRKDSLSKLKNSLAKTSGGESKDSSSPEKESSPAAQM